MKIKMTAIYGDEICEALKEAFKCESDAELLGAFKATMVSQLSREDVDPMDLSLTCEIMED